MPAILSPKSPARWRPPVIAAVVSGALLGAGWMGWAAWRSSDLSARAGAAAGRGDWVRAGVLLERLAWYRPDDLGVLNMRVQAALGRGDAVAAAVLLARVPASAPGAVEARLTQGRLLMEAFRPRAAEAAFRDCLRLDPRADEARLALIAILAVQGRGRDYDAEAWALFEKGGEPIKALRLLAQSSPAIPPDTFTRTADLGDVLRRCLDADPDDPNTRLAVARFERKRGRTDDALRVLEPCLRTRPVDPEATLEWAACLLDEGEHDPLHALFEHPEESMKGRASFWSLRGEWARRTGRNSEALDNHREAVRLDPRSPDARYRLGLALGDAGPEAARCREVARQARELKDLVAHISDRSRDTVRFNRVGRLCAEMGRTRETRAWFALSLRVDPNDAEARAGYDALGPRQAPGRGGADGTPSR